jgi:tetratricopeptide (TPR) repeat protein
MGSDLVAGPEAVATGDRHPNASLVRDLAARGYRVDKLLGQGGFGVVYGATRVRDGLHVAVKIALSQERAGAERLEREAFALRTVGPPAAPIVYESSALVDQPMVVLEYIDAPTLADILVDQAGPMHLWPFVKNARALLRAVSAIHACGLVHRDLKPENVFVVGSASGDPVAKIIDFGQVKDASAPPPTIEHSREQDAIGTAEYMAPEQCEGLSDTDRRADVYSLGILLYEMLAGAPPFWGKPADVREAHRSRRPPPLPARIACPHKVHDIIRSCLAKDRARRFDDAASLARALDEAFETIVEHTLLGQGPTAIVAPTIAPSPLAPLRAALPPSAREKRTMGLLFFDSGAALEAIQLALTDSGGQIVHVSGSQYVAAFGHDAGDNPAQVAVAAGRHLLLSRLCTRLLVDVAAVLVQTRADGTTRIQSTLFTKKDRFPAATEPAGITLMAAAVEVIPDVAVDPIPGNEGRFRLHLDRDARKESITPGASPRVTIGRDAILEQLVGSALPALERGEPTLATILGEPGLGRTHLAGAVAQQLLSAVRSAHVIRMTAQELIVGDLSQTLPDLLRRLADVPGQAPADGGRAFWIEWLGPAVGEPLWGAASFLVGWIGADHPEVQRLAAAPGALRLATSRVTGEALRRRATKHPVALLLDDAHLADEATLDALEYATLSEGRTRIWAAVFARPSFQVGRPAWGARARNTTTVTLGPLAAADAVELVRGLLEVDHVPTSALARLADRTQGSPRLLVELVRGLRRDGLVKRHERGTGYYLATDELDKLPDLPIVQWNARREIETLPAQLVGHARLASILGTEFVVAEIEALIRILEKDEPLDDVQLDAEVGVQRLVDTGLLLRHRTGRIGFRHALLRDTIYELVPADRKQAFHRGAFEMYRGWTDMPPERRLPRLALHAARSGAKEEAAQAYLELAERARRAHAYIEAELAFGAALENLTAPDDARRIDASRGRGLMRFRLGRHDDALKDLKDALGRAHSAALRDAEIDLALDTAIVLDWTRDMTQSAELVERARSLAVAPSELTAARITMGIAQGHHRRNEWEACVRVGTEAAAMAERVGDAGYETMVIALLLVAADCAYLGRLDEADGFFVKALAATRAHRDMHQVATVLNDRVVLWFARQDAEKLFADLEEAARIFREIGAAMFECLTVLNMGEVKYAIDELRSAAELVERSIDLAVRLWGNESSEVSRREVLAARVALYRGDRSDARRLVDRVGARSSSGGPGAALSASEQILYEMVDLATRDTKAEEWDELFRRGGNAGLQPLEQVEILEMRALAAARAGRMDEAKASFEQALALPPNLMSGRVERRHLAMFGPRGASRAQM